MIPFGLEALMTVSLPMARRLNKCLVPGASAVYLCNEGAGTAITDRGSAGNNGTFAAGAAAPVWVTEGLSLDGGDYINLTPATFADTFAAGFTATVVVNLTSATTDQGIIGIGYAKCFAVGVYSTYARCFVGNAGTISRTLNDTIAPNTWTEITFTHTWGGETVAYIDGVEAARDTLTTAYTSPAEFSTTIGSKGTTVAPMTGKLAAVVMYPRALTEAEVAQNHDSLGTVLLPRGVDIKK